MSRIATDINHIKGIVLDIDGVVSCSVTGTDSTGRPIRTADVKDCFALQYAVKHGLHIAVITGGSCYAMRSRFRSLGIKRFYMRTRNKLDRLNQWMDKVGLMSDEVAYIGDDLPDYEAMQAVGLAVAPSDAATEIKAIAQYISPYKGGEGVVRDVVEQVMRAQGLWQIDQKSLHW